MNVTILVTDNGSPPLSFKVGSIYRITVLLLLFFMSLKFCYYWYLLIYAIEFQGNVSVTVLDSNDHPSDIDFTSSLSVTDNTSFQIVIPENSPGGTSLANLSVVDEDSGQQHNCKLLAGRNDFIISSVSKSRSEITLKDGVELNYETLLDTPLRGKKRSFLWYRICFEFFVKLGLLLWWFLCSSNARYKKPTPEPGLDALIHKSFKNDFSGITIVIKSPGCIKSQLTNTIRPVWLLHLVSYRLLGKRTLHASAVHEIFYRQYL